MKYTKAMMEVVDLEMEDVVLTSGGSTCTTDGTCNADGVTPCTTDGVCMLDGVDCRLMG